MHPGHTFYNQNGLTHAWRYVTSTKEIIFEAKFLYAEIERVIFYRRKQAKEIAKLKKANSELEERNKSLSLANERNQEHMKKQHKSDKKDLKDEKDALKDEH